MKSKNVSFGGVMAALALILLYIACVAPSGKLAMYAAASYAIGVCVAVMGIKFGVVAYIAVSVLAFVIIPNKAVAVLFAMFFGNYPIVKLFIEKIKNIYIEWVVKLIAFNIYAVAIWVFARQFFTAEISVALPLFWGVLNIAFIIYDIMFNLVVSKILILKRGRNI